MIDSDKNQLSRSINGTLHNSIVFKLMKQLDHLSVVSAGFTSQVCVLQFHSSARGGALRDLCQCTAQKMTDTATQS